MNALPADESIQLSIVIPAYNEEHGIAAILERILAQLPSLREAGAQNVEVIVVNDGPGFYTTRTLAAYLNEAGKLLDDGVSIEAIDKALVDFGFPVGPITLLDEVGIDVGGKVGLVLGQAFGNRMAPSVSMRRVRTMSR